MYLPGMCICQFRSSSRLQCMVKPTPLPLPLPLPDIMPLPLPAKVRGTCAWPLLLILFLVPGAGARVFGIEEACALPPKSWCSAFSVCESEHKRGMARKCCEWCEVKPGCRMFRFCAREDLGYKGRLDGGWGAWTECSKKCGRGVQFRACDSPAPRRGAPCQGVHVRGCNPLPCASTGYAGQRYDPLGATAHGVYATSLALAAGCRDDPSAAYHCDELRKAVHLPGRAGERGAGRAMRNGGQGATGCGTVK